MIGVPTDGSGTTALTDAEVESLPLPPDEKVVDLEIVPGAIEPGPIETRCKPDEFILMEIADAELFLRMQTEQPSHQKEAARCIQDLQIDSALAMRYRLETVAKGTEQERHVLVTEFRNELPTGWVLLIANERIWQKALQIENPLERCQALDAILRRFGKFQANSRMDILPFGKDLHPVNIESGVMYSQLQNIWNDVGASYDEMEQKFKALWNEWTAIMTSKPAEKPTS